MSSNVATGVRGIRRWRRHETMQQPPSAVLPGARLRPRTITPSRCLTLCCACSVSRPRRGSSAPRAENRSRSNFRVAACAASSSTCKHDCRSTSAFWMVSASRSCLASMPVFTTRAPNPKHGPGELSAIWPPSSMATAAREIPSALALAGVGAIVADNGGSDALIITAASAPAGCSPRRDR